MLAIVCLSLLPAPSAPSQLLFERNGGRHGPEVAFVARAGGQALYLREDGFDLALLPPPNAPRPRTGAGLAVRFAGARPSEPEGVEPLPTRVNYLLGRDPEGWSVDNPTFAEVTQDELWPGIGVRYYDASGSVEHDFLVAPGADPAHIRLRVEGAQGLHLDDEGRLVVSTSLEPLVFTAPVVSQGSRSIPGAFRLLGDDTFGFEIGAYDLDRALVIDPILVYSTYAGGSGFDWLYDVATDAAGAAYVCGESRSTDLPTQAGVLQPALAEYYDAYVAKLSPDGKQLEWCTYLGGSSPVFPYNEDLGAAHGQAIALDSAGNVVVGGYTNCDDFPTTAGALEETLTQFQDGFVTKLTPDGSALVWSTLVGGGFDDRIYGLALGAGDEVFVTGRAQIGFPVTQSGFQTDHGGGQQDAFVLGLTSNGSGLLWSTLYGGSGEDVGRDIEVDQLGRVYVAGFSGSADLAVPGAFQSARLGSSDGFVARIAPGGSTLDYATFIGSTAGGELGSIVDAPGLGVEPTSGRVWYAGWVGGPFSGISPTAFDQTQTVGEGLAALIDTNLTGASSLVHATYVGGSGTDRLFDAEVAPDGDVWLFGGSESALTMVDAWQSSLANPSVGNDNILFELGPDGALKSSTYSGGSGSDSDLKVGRLDVSASGEVTIVSRTASSDAATTKAFESTYGGGVDGLVVRFVPGAPTQAGTKVRVPCSGAAPQDSLLPVGDPPVLGELFTVGIDDPLGQTGFAGGAAISAWAVSIAPAPGAPCGVPLSGTGLGGGVGEILVGVAPGELVLLTSFQVWNGAGLPSLHALGLPNNPTLQGVELFTQGFLAEGTSIVLTEGLDLTLGV